MATAFEKLKALNAQREPLLKEAHDEALNIAEKAIAELNELDLEFNYTLVKDLEAMMQPRGPGSKYAEAAARAPRKAAATGIKRQPRDLPCPICEFKTTPPHDGRKHRSQTKKKAFTVEELMGLGLTKVD